MYSMLLSHINANDQCFPYIVPLAAALWPGPEGGVVVALQNYSPHEDTDLPLHKDQEYILTDSSHHNWWTVQDHRG